MKYELTDNTKVHEGYTLYQIVALKDFNDVKKGDLGGYVQTNNNLSQIRTCWIYDDAIARDNSRVIEDAQLRNNATARDNTYISGQAVITGYMEVGGHNIVNGTTRLDMEVLK